LNGKSVNASFYPAGILNTLSRSEVERLRGASRGELAGLVQQCALAVLNSGNESDDPEALANQYPDFSIEIQQVTRGLRIKLRNAPATAFVDGRIIVGIAELLSAVIRDLVYFDAEIKGNIHTNLEESAGITNAVFEILRNAGALVSRENPDLIVCWGGHSVSRTEYDYSKLCGYELGLRRLNICTGCGPGAMKGPMKGAAVAHAKQRIRQSHYVGITEPGIIGAESPNPIVNNLVIMPDVEKRLEAFVRLGHGIIVFPGGVGTTEEILYLLGILLKPENRDLPMPLIFTGPAETRDYFTRIDQFIRQVLGEEACSRYRIIIGDPVAVARTIKSSLQEVHRYRLQRKDAFYFNWLISIDEPFQSPFTPTHENMRKLRLARDRPVHEHAADLRRVFSGIVSGNVKPEGMAAIRRHGPFEIHGEKAIMESLDSLLGEFVARDRMKIPADKPYRPCYRIVQ